MNCETEIVHRVLLLSMLLFIWFDIFAQFAQFRLSVGRSIGPNRLSLLRSLFSSQHTYDLIVCHVCIVFSSSI